MNDTSGDIILLTRDDEVRRSVLDAVPAARPYRYALEALADMATVRVRALVTTPAALGYRAQAILRAARTAQPASLVCVACRPEDEPQAMKIADADDYFLVPFGLGDLARAVSGGAAVRQTEPGGPGDDRDAEQVEPDNTLRAAVYDGLQAIARTARQSADRIADQMVKAVARFDGVTATAVVAGGGQPAPLAASHPDADWSAAIEALSRPGLPQEQWVRVDRRTWVYAPDGTSHAGPAVAVCTESPPAAAEHLLGALATVVRVSLALVGAARDREAALKALSTDSETGLASRRYIDHYLPAVCRLAAEGRREVTLALVSPTGGAAEARMSLAPLAALMRESFPSAKLARLGELELVAVFAGMAGPALASQLEAFAARADEAALSVPVAIAAATFPWHASDTSGLVKAARSHLAESARTGRPVIQ